MKTINGVTEKQITSLMIKIEGIISFYNKKYNFQIENAPVSVQKKYESNLKSWDLLKSKRDTLKLA